MLKSRLISQDRRRADMSRRIICAKAKVSKARGDAYFNHIGRCFVSTGRRLKGCREILTSTFWSNYRQPKVAREGSGQRGSGWGHFRGKRVDTELTLFSCGIVLDPIHDYTRKVIALLRQKSWKIVEGQHVVAHPYFRVGTAADLVVKDPSGRVIYLEVKCGYHEVWDQSCVSMSVGDFYEVPNCPKFHSLVQLAFTMWLGGFGSKHQPTTGYVVRVHDGGISLHELPEFLRHESVTQNFEDMCTGTCMPSKAWRAENGLR